MKFKSVAKLEIGAVGTFGTMGSTLTDYRNKLVTQTFQISFPKGTVIKEYIDGADVPDIAIAGRPEAATMSFKLNKLGVDDLVQFLGGTKDGTLPAKYNHSGIRKTLYKSVKITADEIAGEALVWEIPYALVTSGIVGNPTADAVGKAELDVQIEMVTPVDEDGDPLPPFTIYDLNDHV